MSDKHFLTQSGFNGIVLLLFASGCWFVNDSVQAMSALKYMVEQKNAALLLTTLIASASSPLLGMLVQGVVMVFFFIFGHPYVDQSRQLAANVFRANVAGRDDLSPNIKKCILNVSDDSIFVALYYKEAESHQVEWARRRRDFQHIGENWSVAAVCGVILSLCVQEISQLPANIRGDIVVILSLLFLLFWVFSMFFLRNRMKKDADGMELVWLLNHMYPNLFTPSDLILPYYRCTP